MRRIQPAGGLLVVICVLTVTAARCSAADKPLHDRWLARHLEGVLDRSVGKALSAEQIRMFDDALLARLRCGHIGSSTTVDRLVFLARAAEALSGAAAIEHGGPSMAGWLWRHKDFLREFCRALADCDDRDAVLMRMHCLYRAGADEALEHPQLAIAAALAGPAPDNDEPAKTELVKMFRAYAGKTLLRTKPQSLPFELSRFVMAGRLTEAERQWAVKTYAGKSNTAEAFFDIRLDRSRIVPGSAATRPVADLKALRDSGGSPADQAHYAVEICRALGIPAAMVRAGRPATVQAMWVTHLQRAGGRPRWNNTTARHRQSLHLAGTLPGGQPENQLQLTAAAVMVSADRRTRADTMAELARRVEDGGARDGKPDLLGSMAAEYNRVRKPGQGPRPSTDWVRNIQPLDAALVEAMLVEALKSNPANGRAWRHVIGLLQTRRLSSPTSEALLGLATRQLTGTCPDFTADAIALLSSNVTELARRDAHYKAALAALKSRKDLHARLMIHIGDDYLARGHRAAALKVYTTAARAAVRLGHIGADASERADTVWAKSGVTEPALKFFEDMFARCDRGDASGVFFVDSAYVRIGYRYAALLDHAGKSGQADVVRQKLTPRKPATTPATSDRP